MLHPSIFAAISFERLKVIYMFTKWWYLCCWHLLGKKQFALKPIAYISLFAVNALLFADDSAAQSIYFSADATTSTQSNSTPDSGLTGSFNTSLENISNLSGLSESPMDSNIDIIRHETGFDSDIQFVDASQGGVTTGATTGNFVFDFLSSQTITDVLVWNYTQGSTLSNRGVGDYTIEVDTGSGLSQIASGSLLQANVNQHNAQVIDIPDQVGVTQLVLTAVTNLGGDSLGLDEVLFRDGTNIQTFPPGDVTLDGVVDSADFARIGEFMLNDVLAVDDPGNPMGYSSREQGDLNGDGRIDLSDFGIFKDDPSRSAALKAGSATVPEPATYATACLMALALFYYARRCSY